jgi:hypothetical protein
LADTGGMEARAPTPLIDPGWLFLVAGLMVLSATVLIPARDDLDQARWLRDRGLAIERERTERLERYREFAEALEGEAPALVMSLAASQLHQIPADRRPIPGLTPAPDASAGVFPSLEPDAPVLVERRRPDSALYRWTTNERTRMWLICGGALLVLIGLLPPGRRGVTAGGEAA